MGLQLNSVSPSSFLSYRDERDELLKEPNLGPTNAALLAKNAQLQHQIQKLEAQLAISSTETNPQATSSSSSPSTTANQRSDASQLKIQMLEARIKELESAPSSKSPESSNSTSAAGKRKMLEPSNLEEEREDKVSASLILPLVKVSTDREPHLTFLRSYMKLPSKWVAFGGALRGTNQNL